MGNQKSQGPEYPGRLQWVATPIGEHRWTDGPIFCRTRGAGWTVELSRHGERGRVSVPLAGPFEKLGEAKEAAASLVLRARARYYRRFAAESPIADGREAVAA